MNHRIANKKITHPGKKSHFQIWWHMLRPHTLTASFVPVALGTALSLESATLHWPLFLAMMIACILIQAATNMFNEYFDYKRGLDNESSVGIGGGIVREGIRPKTVVRVAFSLFGVAALIGIYICLETTWWIAVIGVVCMAAGYFYTGGPLPIAYTPFGELTSGFFMGFVIIMLSYYVQAETISLHGILLSIPVSILVGAILLSNNIRDLDGDQQNGRKTLAILLGRPKAIVLLTCMFIISYVWIISLVIAGMTPIWSLLVLFSTPKAFQASRGFAGKTMPMQMMPAMKATAQTNTAFGFLLSVGIVLGHVFGS
ncbi:1,4-dihydroxy-2-naphthoate polyprenyltransferase [Bacillaceae bacterium SIJ1]|uniref:1,4-dihydroxy-2-naphthoate polyprenyltransferase n=1 Tax=Litoribacterium kuwaitense TaxID=1398745 RepID=UPI0013EA2BED|nr:1,4-dihydroxy-2-naphthoate polyprenyltransferase [Litoribacterium kuwaitense]NGP44241.1 1,4-dihydroxy-2-naphthoate polyprenyltransferase [Litoribacterium kuwaitense]